MTAFVLVHGAFRGGWYWRDVAASLRSSGHDVFAPSLTGAGDRAHLPQPTTLRTYVDDLIGVLDSWDLGDTVLVAHSFAGVPVVAASEERAGRIARLAFIDAAVPGDGERAVDLMPAAAAGSFPDPPPDAVLPPRPLSAEEGIDAATVAWANQRLSPFPVAPSLDPVTLRNPHALAIPRSFAFGRTTPPIYPAARTRAQLDEQGISYDWLPTGHDAALEAPGVVVEWLLAVAGR